MRSTISKEKDTWVIKIYLDKKEKSTDKNKAKSYEQIDEAFEFLKEIEAIEKKVRKVYNKIKKCDHLNSYDFHENAPAYCPDCGKYINE